MMVDPESDIVQSLVRGLAVIRAFDHEHARMTLSAVAARTDMPRASARRSLRTLQSLGYVVADGREYSLTPRVLELGFSFLASSPLTTVLHEQLNRLSDELGESTSASILEGTDIMYVSRIQTHSIMTSTIAVGTRFPAHATAMGRVLLAGLGDEDFEAFLEIADLQPLTPHTVTEPRRIREIVAETRDRGYATVVQELEFGLQSVAVPVRDARGAVITAINASMRVGASADDSQRLQAALPALRATASAIEDGLHATRR